MQEIIDYIRNHPIYIIDAIVIVYVVILFRKKAQQERQTRIDILHDSIAAKGNVVPAKNNDESGNSTE